MEHIVDILKEKMIVVTIMSSGVSSDGGGWIIIGGKFVRIPPRSPAFQKLTSAALVLERIDGLKGVEELEEAAKKTMKSAVQELI